MSASTTHGFEVRHADLSALSPSQPEGPVLAPEEGVRLASTAPHAAFPGSEPVESRLRRRAAVVTVLVWLPVLALAGAVGFVPAHFGWVDSSTAWLLAGAVLALQLLGLGLTVVQAFWSARRYLRSTELHPITARTQPALHALCVDVAERMGVDLPPCYVKEDPSVNAFATLTGFRRPVFVLHTGYLKVATPDAVRGVVAHELAHILNKDSLVDVLAHGSGRLLSSTSSALARPKRDSWRRKSTTDEILDVLGAIFGKGIPRLYHALFMALSRSRESLADLTAARALGGADPMIASLRLLVRAASEARGGHAAPAGKEVELLSSHPATRRRIELLLDTCGEQVSRLP